MTALAPIPEKHGGGPADRSNVRLWLRLLSCTMAIEKELQRRFAAHGTTLPRFDMLAALARHPEGMAMGALSQTLLVSNGNVTQVANILKREGLIEVAPLPTDRRTQIVTMTEKGRRQFDALARRHGDWIDELIGDVAPEERDALYAALGAMKLSIAGAARERMRA